MCGIAGIVVADRHEAEAAIRRMVPAMVHRGPDDAGCELLPATFHGAEATAAFGFRRLAILDLSPAGHQPMIDAATGNCLVFNGEIYNFRGLREELETIGCRFRSASDSEVLLHALGRWGEHALGRLEGMYAFAFYRAHDRSVLIGRDPLGIKPLYVSNAGGRFLFASEVRTLLASGLVSREVDVEGVAAMLAFGSPQAPRTVFARIREFPAGHCQWVGGESRRFWDFPQTGTAAPPDAPAMVRQAIGASVRRHLVADVPVGILLSAGIDSTVIAACAAESAADVTSFTVGIGDRYPEDEAAVATETARRLGMSHVTVPIETAGLSGLWHRWIEALDSPSVDGFNTWIVTRALAERGIKVGLSGLGADELFGGYVVFSRAPALARLLGVSRFFPRSIISSVVGGLLRRLGRPGAAEKIPGLLAGAGDPAAIAMAYRRINSDPSLAALGMRPPSDDRTFDDQLDAFNVVSRVEMTHYMKNTLLRDSDATSMSHSLELRVPFLDLPLVNAVTALPGSAKQAGGGQRKRLLREAFAAHLPEAVTARRKTGFTLPTRDWIRGDMRDYCTAAIEAAASLHCLRGDVVRRLWRDHLASPTAVAWTQPFSLIVLGSYVERHANS